ncbi:MAG TPA: efflux RND transporter permease subunit [Terriglobia bacterium]|nr:efflux RND transporter permease subunit [Terriglobia bacterium]
MWIVRLALRRPYTIAVMALFIVFMGILSMTRMIADIFPTIDIPVVMAVWSYQGLSAQEMERRVILIAERSYSTSVNGIDRIESESIPGIGLMKLYFQPGTEVGGAIAQISASSGPILRILPPGIQPPTIIQYNASNVPVTQLTLSSDTMPEQNISDYAVNFLRVQLFTIPGIAIPGPYGGKQREVTVDVLPKVLAAKGLSASDIVSVLQSSNVIIPAGTARIGKTEYNVMMNSSPSAVREFDQIPVKVVGGAPVLLGEVARVADGFADQESMVHVNGKRAAYIAILKHADASTLTVVDSVRGMLPLVRATAPKALNVKMDFDQSVFVRGAVTGVVREAVLASLLVSFMILIFLGSWRSMVIVCTSIPLSILVGIIGLKLTGNTFNIMTLGGLALAIGMLVDDATVAVENIHRNHALGKPLTVAILDGAREVSVPAIVATLAICIVFFPVVLLYGPARFLFTPLALSVVLSMLASYLLSRTLVTTMYRKLMVGHDEPVADGERAARLSPLARLSAAFNRGRDRAFDSFREAYGRVLETGLHHRVFTLTLAALIALASVPLILILGEDFFPTVDAGLMKIHFRGPIGTRIEETEKLVLQVEDRIRKIVPADELETVNDLVGVPFSYNLAYVSCENVGTMDAEISIALKPEHHPTRIYMREIRRALRNDFPGASFWFQPADITTQVLNFGLAEPIDVQVQGLDFSQTYPLASRLRSDFERIPGVADAHISQVLNYPTLHIDVDRIRAAQIGLSQQQVANTVLISLSSSSLIAPSYFLNPVNNVNYFVVVKVPLPEMASIQSLTSTPITPPGAVNLLQPGGMPGPTDLPALGSDTLGSVSSVYREDTPASINHYTVQRVLDVEAGLEGRDLGAVIRDIRAKIAALGNLPPSIQIKIRGQNQVMEDSFRSLLLGLLVAIVLVYFLMVILFQSWIDPFIIMFAVPGALVGILWMLALTGTTLNVESLMGSIMAVGIAVSNSILLVSFANDIRVERGMSALEAVLEAGKTRLRPVLMTALAMIIGMIPMALALGEAGEQNAPLGRAVIGGLVVATVVTLLVVPVIYSLLRKGAVTKHLLEERFLAEERGEEPVE